MCSCGLCIKHAPTLRLVPMPAVACNRHADRLAAGSRCIAHALFAVFVRRLELMPRPRLAAPCHLALRTRRGGRAGARPLWSSWKRIPISTHQPTALARRPRAASVGASAAAPPPRLCVIALAGPGETRRARPGPARRAPSVRAREAALATRPLLAHAEPCPPSLTPEPGVGREAPRANTQSLRRARRRPRAVARRARHDTASARPSIGAPMGRRCMCPGCRPDA